MIIWVLSIYSFLLVGLLYYGNKRTEYSHARDTISELAENGSEYEKHVSYFVFLPFGLGILFIEFFVNSPNEALSILLLAVGLSYALSAFFPCDSSTPAIGSWKNVLHNLVGAGCYVAMLHSLMELSESDALAMISFSAICVLLVSFVIGWPKRYLGYIQRIAEFSVFLVILVRLI